MNLEEMVKYIQNQAEELRAQADGLPKKSRQRKALDREADRLETMIAPEFFAAQEGCCQVCGSKIEKIGGAS